MTRPLGKLTAPLLKFRRHDTPRSARDFKRKYPSDFEALKGQTGGRDFTDEVIAGLRAKNESPIEWTVIEDVYDPSSSVRAMRQYLDYYPQAPNADYVRQRLSVLGQKKRACGDDNEVILMCVDTGDLDLSERQERLFEAISQAAEHSGHPSVEPPLFAVGWVRFCRAHDTWLVEEVQTDVNGVRRAVEDRFMQQQLRAQGVTPEEVLAVMDLVEPWHRRFYEDAMGVLLERAAEAGVSVEMVDYTYKADEEAPRSVYSDLPRAMGMKLSDGSRVSDAVDKTWKITPNLRRP